MAHSRTFTEQLHHLRCLNDEILKTTDDINESLVESEITHIESKSVGESITTATTTTFTMKQNSEIVHYLLPFLNSLIKSFYSFYEHINDVEQLDFQFSQFRKSMTFSPVCKFSHNTTQTKDLVGTEVVNKNEWYEYHNGNMTKLFEILDTILILQTQLLNAYNNKHNSLKTNYQLDILYSIFIDPKSYGLKESDHVKSLRLEMFNVLLELFKSEFK
ncbi:uncharacterized protein GVI51_L05687 [Nakaseomyces glabratus]|uniref:Uncharacterized protein n=2 Tax=Candida glabrata TaxID=5478 RepID=Q6FL66_CANGA|nr:uncharacterized protein CAGL0L05830g [Nakaseomyces glabratus]KAH7580941.1 hypothetical protein J7296_04308 [Nakaseomyces glabratus]KAH7581519.1 hypothetical protein J7298_04344 [Nakaseomyces glabratus]KAH7582781.1 hypothetical protein J7297_04401 [Nakaseomyces glabratus]KAH7595081.1 hypothetical protein J7295_04304 [Nakaseomyces glabratus]KAH7595510.1 hypothetical protein J7294_04336 [Nakaseomyces glabratus]|eukprot:XP_449028.1 uncharacterized protein CAGL0L05830g [[Candida] glabrata]